VTSDALNGVPRDQFGVWCRHGKHIVVADPDNDDPYQEGIPADPWPCGQGCTWETYLADREYELALHEQDQMTELDRTR